MVAPVIGAAVSALAAAAAKKGVKKGLSKKAEKNAKEEARKAAREEAIANAKTTVKDGVKVTEYPYIPPEKALTANAAPRGDFVPYAPYRQGADFNFKKGGVVKSSASKRADGCAVKGKTKGRMV
jgi:hypothetical protein